jgi:hypothetical protein
LRVALVDALHRCGIGRSAVIVIELVGVRVEDGERLDIVSFASSGSIQIAGGGEKIGAALEIGFGRVFPKLVIKAHGLTPVGHGALLVVLSDGLKFVVGFLVLEGVEKSYPARERVLNGGGARGGERNGFQFFGGVVVVRFLSGAGEREEGGYDEKRKNADFHDGLQVPGRVCMRRVNVNVV